MVEQVGLVELLELGKLVELVKLPGQVELAVVTDGED